MSIGKNIRNKRLELEMTQDELANQLFVTRQTISNYESGKREPSIETLALLATIFDCEIEELIYGKRDMKKRQHICIMMLVVIFFAFVFISSLFNCEKTWTTKTYKAPFIQWSSLVLFYPMLLWAAGYVVGNLYNLNKGHVPKFLKNRYVYHVGIGISIIYGMFCLPYVLNLLLQNLEIYDTNILKGTVFVNAHYMIWLWIFHRYVYIIFFILGGLVNLSKRRER